MSTINEKLEYFSKIALEEATKKRDEILQKMKEDKETLMRQKREEFHMESQEQLSKILKAIENEKNDIIAKSFSEGRQLLAKTREQIKKIVFDEVDLKINEFINSSDYIDYLINSITNSCKLAGEGELIVYLCKKDIDLITNNKDKLPSKILFEEASDEIIGGCRVLNKTKNTIIDNTISKKLKQSMDSFFEISCLRID
ncbi:UNVERIFIED_CONTAM: vacuolar-type H+-ATPase subunit E/Vma4 [Acetivibrio alkalicellulosi]